MGMPCRLAPCGSDPPSNLVTPPQACPEASARLGRSLDRQRSAGGPLAVPPPQLDLGGPPSTCTKGGKEVEPGQSGRREIGEFTERSPIHANSRHLASPEPARIRSRKLPADDGHLIEGLLHHRLRSPILDVAGLGCSRQRFGLLTGQIDVDTDLGYCFSSISGVWDSTSDDSRRRIQR